ncbi:MAG: YqaJ viral recombinase family protein [Mariprofundaceae bacterium]|nr:YqaJ viral recombinase family protein [Mariprofundaceae bacterium]
MNIIEGLVQGTDEWKKHREGHYNASDAPAMLGVSSYKSRDALIKEYATGKRPEIDPSLQRLFDSGHRAEADARLIIEEEHGEELFPVTATLTVQGLPLSASFDGIDMLETFCFEHKLLNHSFEQLTSIDELRMQYKVQMQQQLMVSGAKKCLFVASDGIKEGMVKLWFKSDKKLEKEIIAGWKQFKKDVEAWKPEEDKVEVVAKSVEQLPSLNIQLTGDIQSSNLAVYESNALAFIQSINTDLQTDSDFADADAIVKFCSKTEKELKQVKQAALDQTEDIAALFKTIDNLSSEMRSKRLDLDKLVKARKLAIKDEIVQEAKAAFIKHVETLNQRLPEIAPFVIALDSLDASVKNKRTIESLHNAVNTELATLKIASNEHADLCEGNIKALKEIAGDYGFLFRDLKDIVTKERDDLLNLARQRIAEHKEAEEKRLEAEREAIRVEEEAKAQAKVEAQRKADEAKKLANVVSLVDEANQEQQTNTSNKVSPKKSEESKPSQESDKPDYKYFREQIVALNCNLEGYNKDELRTAFTRLADAV